VLRNSTRLPILLCSVLTGCGIADETEVEATAGTPFPGVTTYESEQFVLGQALFNRTFTPEEGLGPLFNQVSCSSCHDLPTSGGHGAEPVTKVSDFDERTGCNLLKEDGGDLLQASVVPALRTAGILPERIPVSATAVTELRAPALYGIGLVEAIEDEDILIKADPYDQDGDGISGRPGLGPDGSLGRFGSKAQHATLSEFIENAIRGEMGLTTPAHPVEEMPNGLPLPEGSDPVPDPEIETSDLTLLSAYIGFLAQPPRRTLDSPEDQAASEEGRQIFANIGCATCHTPTLVTGNHQSAALNRKRFRNYSDLLLHDMGPELASICAPGASPSEWRTTRLVGLYLRSEFLHDGRARSVRDAILMHGGEAESARYRFQDLNPELQQSVLLFLRTL
tara:strand:+ start:13747 stop:14928 length:1182 start_codon:yes stop_codon:yes gene_type:complete